MIAALVRFFRQNGPDEHHAGGATSTIAGTTALAGKFFRVLMTSVPLWILVVHQAAAAPQTMDTTFRHSYHKSVSCLECHGTTSTHGGLKITAPAGCLGCHHSAQQKVACATCHKTDALPAYSVPVTFAISARPAAVTRPLSFTHTRHSEVTCTRCHSSDAKRTVTLTACTTCHSEHHVATTNCANCHPSARTGHDRGVHSGCAGCHTDSRLASLPAGRPLCLVCHQEQRNHYPARECATCHALDPNTMLHAGRSGGGAGDGRNR